MGATKIVTGIILILIGLVMLMFLPVVGIIWGIILIIIGLLFLVFHEDEKKIEDIKRRKK